MSRRDEAVADLIQQVEWMFGELDTTSVEVEGDDDRSIMEHNFRCVVDRLLAGSIEDWRA